MDGQPTDPTTLHHNLIDNLVQEKLITTPAVEAAFRAVRREHFVPELSPEDVYQNRAIITKVDENGRPISSSSQPAVMAIMLEQLDLRPGHNVLEIGAGTGYNAALMAHMVGERGHITTVDIDDDLAQSARSYLAAAGFEQVEVVCGDGMRGFPANAPYDHIILTVAGWDIPPEWLAQLKPDGRISLPLSFYGPQLCVVFYRQDGHLVSEPVKACGFMSVRGPRSEPLRKIRVGDDWEIILVRDDDEAQSQESDPAVLERWLREPFVEQTADLELTAQELLFRWPLWAVLQEPNYILVTTANDAANGELIADLLPPLGLNMGVLTGSGLALLVPPPGANPSEDNDPFARSFALHIRSYGPDETAGERLLRQFQIWDNAGRPWKDGTTVVALPANESPASTPADVWLTRRWHHFGVRWGAE